MRDELISAQDAEKLLGKSRRTIHRLVASGKLPVAMRLPGTTGAMLFHRSDVLALAEQTTGAAS